MAQTCPCPYLPAALATGPTVTRQGRWERARDERPNAPAGCATAYAILYEPI